MKKTIVLLLSLFSFGCFRSEKNLGSPQNPLVLGLSKPYYEKLSSEAFSLLEKKINEKVGLFVKVEKFPESAGLIKQIGAGKVDMALLSVNEYLIARQDYKALPVLQVLRGKEKKYFAGIAAIDRSINSIDDLKGKKIAARDPYSISGFVLPSMFFVKEKIKPHFVFTGSHEESIKRLFTGEVQAASVYENMIKADKRLRLIQIMGPVPNEPVICRKGLKPELCLRLKDALLSIAMEKEGKEILHSMADITGFDPVIADVYRDLHEIILYSGQDIYSLVPDSADLRKIQEPYYFD
ncbi:MAG: phosphate/phosphite/phosphonate ABC transporter substrate-binding protein [Elusimicrobiota bacterium]